MTRPLVIVPLLALAFVIAWPPAPAAAQGLMQCMEQCIRHEGGNTAANKETCKARCANVPSAAGGGYGTPGGGGDCMSRYKDCQADCAKDRACRRTCKSVLMRCK